MSITTRFMQGDRTYGVYIQDTRDAAAKTLSSSDVPEIGTGKAVERIIPLYIGYGGEKQ